MNKKILVICGATASGKSAYAIEQALKYDGIILNADSMQIYKHIPILTAQPSEEDMRIVGHELYGFFEVGEKFSVGKWLNLVVSGIKEIINIGKTPILVGGTGMYLKSLIDGFADIPGISAETEKYIVQLDSLLSTQELHDMLKDKDAILYERLKVNDRKRILRAIAVYYETKKPLSWWQQNNHTLFFNRENFFITLINPPREVIYNNCNQRFIKMFECGAIDEARFLLEHYPNIPYPEAIGLKEIISYIQGNITKENAIIKAQQLTRNYAKRQLTWFKHWISYDSIMENYHI